MRLRHEDVRKLIDKDQKHKRELEDKIQQLKNELSKVNENLSKKEKLSEEYARIISTSEAAYQKVCGSVFQVKNTSIFGGLKGDIALRLLYRNCSSIVRSKDCSIYSAFERTLGLGHAFVTTQPFILCFIDYTMNGFMSNHQLS